MPSMTSPKWMVEEEDVDKWVKGQAVCDFQESRNSSSVYDMLDIREELEGRHLFNGTQVHDGPAYANEVLRSCPDKSERNVEFFIDSCASKDFSFRSSQGSTSPECEEMHQCPETIIPLRTSTTPPDDTTIAISPRELSLDPVQKFVSRLVNNILEALVGFDGTTTWLKRRHPDLATALLGATAVKNTAEDIEEFTVPWFGIGAVVIRDSIVESLADVVIQTSGESVEESNGAFSLCPTVSEVSLAFVSGLESIVNDVINGCGCHGKTNAGGRYFPRAATRSCSYTKEIVAISNRMMRDRVTESAIPACLRETYASENDNVATKGDFEGILQSYSDAWLCSFFPTYQHISQRASDNMRLLWKEEEELVDSDLGLCLYHLFSICGKESLLKDAAGFNRGVIVPTKWMEELLAWSQSAASARDNFTSATVPQSLGPIDTFSLVSRSPQDPRCHWLCRSTELYQVIPEKMFDSFSLLFGTGPKYMMYGSFSLQRRCLSTWRPKPLVIDTTFEWRVTDAPDGVREEREVTVYVENALMHSDMREVCHLAWGLVNDEDGVMAPQDLASWFSAVNSNEVVTIQCKGLFMLSVTPFNVTEAGDDMSISVLELLKMLKNRIECFPGYLEEWREQTESKISLSLVVSLNEGISIEDQGGVSGHKKKTSLKGGVCGLTNVGNTCYMNSALQCLSNLASFRTLLMTLPISHHVQATITPLFIKLLTAMWSGEEFIVNTRELKDNIGLCVRRFAGSSQQDANEFIEVLLDHINEEINSVSTRSYLQRQDSDKDIPVPTLSTIFWENFLLNNQSFIPKLFFHQSKTVFKCLTCGESSIVFDNNVTLSVSIKEKPPRRFYEVEAAIEFVRKGVGVVRSVESAENAIQYACFDFLAPLDENGKLCETKTVELICDEVLHSAAFRHAAVSFFQADNDEDLEDSGHQQSLLEDFQKEVSLDVSIAPAEEGRRVFAWIRCTNSPRSESTSSKGSVIPLVPSSPVYRVWYFFLDRNDIRSTLPTCASWVDEFSLNLVDAVPNSGEKDCSATLVSQQIIDHGMLLAKRALTPIGIGAIKDEKSLDDLFPSSKAIISGVRSMAEPNFCEPGGHTEREEDGGPPPDPTESLKILCRNERGHFSVKALMAQGGDQWIATWVDEPTCEVVNIFVGLVYDGESFELKEKSSLSFSRKKNQNNSAAEPSHLSDCLQLSQQLSVLRGDDLWFCSKCKELRETQVQRTLFRLPPCLFVSFKRFKMNAHGADKNNALVNFPLDIDFAPYLDSEALELQTEGTIFRLRGVVYHSGSLSFGHYTAWAYNDSVQEWVNYNDSFTTVESGKVPPSHNAYILCYERIPKRNSF